MKSITKKELGKSVSHNHLMYGMATEFGKKKGCTYFCGIVSIKEYENGWIIKPVKQKAIMIDKICGFGIAEMIRNKNQLYTIDEARPVLAKEVADKL